MVDNFLYEIREYGKILNANRTYYLTRSQPPFLTGMILLLYRHTHDRKWLEDTVPAIEKYYSYWTTDPHLTRRNRPRALLRSGRRARAGGRVFRAGPEEPYRL